MFHLMTHAFFKALLFMAAGSVIARDGGRPEHRPDERLPPGAAVHRRRCWSIGALALAGFPGTSGFFSKDEILAFAVERGGIYWMLAIGGYVGALLTAFYAFRIGFRVLAGEPCEEAKELEERPPRPRRAREPATGENEDTDVGFPGPEHHIAERRPADEGRDGGARRSSRCSPACSRSRASTDVVDNFLEPTSRTRRCSRSTPATATAWLGLADRRR